MSPESQIRLGLYGHLSAAMTCEAFSLAERGEMISHEVSWLFTDGPLQILILPALLAWIVCPLIVAIGAYEAFKQGKHRTAAMGIICELLMCFGQFVAILPGVH